MEEISFQIENIPAVLWGAPSPGVILAVHGRQSSKSDTPIVLLAQTAAERGWQVLSFDLPEHGDRRAEPTLCKTQTCVAELAAVLRYAKRRWDTLGLFANSLGAYFSLTAYQDERFSMALFLSPVVDLERITRNMMGWFHVSEETLAREGTVQTPIGQPLYWDDYRFIREHPVHRWNTPTSLLYGGRDTLCERDAILRFAQQFSCKLELAEEAEHYFHTPEQLTVYQTWLAASLPGETTRPPMAFD